MSFKKTALIISGCFVGITLIFFAFMAITGPDEEKTCIDIGKIYDINVCGINGQGYVYLSVNKAGEEILKKYNIHKDDIDVEISKEKGLSNGDTFKLTVVNEKSLNSKNIFIKGSGKEYVVSELEETHDFDVFADIKVSLDDQGKVVIDTKEAPAFVRDNVDFYVKDEKPAYSPSDVVTIGAHTDENVLKENGYEIRQNFKDFILN